MLPNGLRCSHSYIVISMAATCRKHQLQGQILTTAIWKPSLEYEHRMRTLCPLLSFIFQLSLVSQELKLLGIGRTNINTDIVRGN
jgi:hypothetical protein